jgi:hypothetical protein
MNVIATWYLILVVTQGIGSLEVETVKFNDAEACKDALTQLTKGGGQATYSSTDHRVLKLLDGSVKITGYCVASATATTTTNAQ